MRTVVHLVRYDNLVIPKPPQLLFLDFQTLPNSSYITEALAPQTSTGLHFFSHRTAGLRAPHCHATPLHTLNRYTMYASSPRASTRSNFWVFFTATFPPNRRLRVVAR